MGRAHFDPPTTARENVLSLPVSSLHNWLSCIRMYVDNDCPIVPRLWPFFGLWMTAVVRPSHLVVSWTPRIIITPYHDVIHHGLSQGQIVVDGLSFHWALWPFLGDVWGRAALSAPLLLAFLLLLPSFLPCLVLLCLFMYRERERRKHTGLLWHAR